jgi:hypothetical protein
MPDLGRRSRRAVWHDAQRWLRTDRLGLARRAGRARYARLPRRGPCPTTRTRQRPGMVEPRKVAPRGSDLHKPVPLRDRRLARRCLVAAILVALSVGSRSRSASRVQRVPQTFVWPPQRPERLQGHGDISWPTPTGRHAHAVISARAMTSAVGYTRDGTQLTFPPEGVGRQRSNADDRRPGRIGGSGRS